MNRLLRGAAVGSAALLAVALFATAAPLGAQPPDDGMVNINTLKELATIHYPEVAEGGSRVPVSWSASVHEGATYQIERQAVGSEDWTLVATTPQTAFTDTPPTGSFTYRVRAVLGAESSPWIQPGHTVHVANGRTESRAFTTISQTPMMVSILSPPNGTVLPKTTDEINLVGETTTVDPVNFSVSYVEYRYRSETVFNAPSGVTFTYTNSGPWKWATPKSTSPASDWSQWSATIPLAYGKTNVDVYVYSNQGNTSSEVSGHYVTRQPPVGANTFQCLTDIGEVWSFYPAGNGDESTKIGTIGFKNDVVNGWQSAAGDVNGDYLTDLVCVTPAGDLWLSKQITFAGGYETPVRQSWGWSVNETNGAGILVGDVNGDGLDDVVQFTASGVAVALSNAGAIPYSTSVGDPGIQYRPQDGYWVGLERVNSDPQADLVQVDPLGDVYVAWGLPDGTFANKQFRSHPNFVFNRTTEFGIAMGDINGDSRSDLVQVTPLGEAWVALSINTGFSEPFKAGKPGFRFAPNVGDGWSVHVIGELYCLTQYGDVWRSNYSNGILNTPTRVKFLNYKNGPPAPWLFFPSRR